MTLWLCERLDVNRSVVHAVVVEAESWTKAREAYVEANAGAWHGRDLRCTRVPVERNAAGGAVFTVTAPIMLPPRAKKIAKHLNGKAKR